MKELLWLPQLEENLGMLTKVMSEIKGASHTCISEGWQFIVETVRSFG